MGRKTAREIEGERDSERKRGQKLRVDVIRSYFSRGFDFPSTFYLLIPPLSQPLRGERVTE